MTASGEARGTIFVEDAEVLRQQAHADQQYTLQLRAPKTAVQAMPGHFVHVACAPRLPMCRPLSIMGTDPDQGSVELLYKVVGTGTRLLAEREPGDSINLLGPIGQPFRPDPQRPRCLLIGGGVGIPPMVFLAEGLARRTGFQPFLVMGSEVPFPFRTEPSRVMVPGMPDGAIAAMAQMEALGVPSRLASMQGFPGCFDGLVTDLARSWLAALDANARQQVAVYACGPHGMLRAVAALAKDFELPCQVSLEEFMACGVGGCAGCTVAVKTPSGPAMRRVCVDGPVFDAADVFS